MTTLSLEGSDYAMESNPKGVNENLARAKKIREKAGEEIEPLAKNIFGLESLIKVIKANKNIFEKVKKSLLDTNSEIYKNIPDNQKNSIKNMVESSKTPLDLIAKIMVFKKSIEDKKEKLEEEADDEIAKIIKSNAKEVSNRREKQKEVLVFLKSIGFDLIPKKVTDYVVARVKE